MFVRETTARGHRYLYLVESVREGKRVRQRTIRALGRLQEAAIEKDGKRITTRTHVEDQVGKVFQAVGIALPPKWREHKA